MKGKTLINTLSQIHKQKKLSKKIVTNVISQFTKTEASVQTRVQFRTFIRFEIIAAQQLKKTLFTNAPDKSKVGKLLSVAM